MVFFRFVSTVTWYVAFCYFSTPWQRDIFPDCLKRPCWTGTYTQKKANSWFFLSEVWLFISVFPVMWWRTFSGFDPLDSWWFLLPASNVLTVNVILDRDGLMNLSRPPFETPSWHPLCNANDWLLDDNTDTLLPRGSKNTYGSPQFAISFHLKRLRGFTRRGPLRMRWEV